MNYTELVSTIKAYAENDFPDTEGAGGLTSDEQIDTFIRQAEQRVFNSVQLLDFRKTDTLTCTPSARLLSTPTDWLSNYSIAVIDADGAYEFLLEKDVSFIREAFPSPADTGKPTHYAYYDSDQFLLGPTPDDDYSVELNYFFYPESIVDAGTSWLGDNFDQVLLYGSLLEAAAFMKSEEDVTAVYSGRYAEALSLLKQLGDGKNRTDTYRTGQIRLPVQ